MKFHCTFTNIVGNVSLLKLSKSLIFSKPHYWRKHILIKILTAQNTSSQYLHPINIKEIHFSVLLNGDTLVILGHFCHKSAPASSRGISCSLSQSWRAIQSHQQSHQLLCLTSQEAALNETEEFKKEMEVHKESLNSMESAKQLMIKFCSCNYLHGQEGLLHRNKKHLTALPANASACVVWGKEKKNWTALGWITFDLF